MDSRTMLRIVLFLWRMDYDTILNIVFFLFFTSGTASARLPESLAEVPSRLLFETHTESGSVMTWIADHVPVIVGLALALALALAVFHTCCRKAGPPTRIAEETNPGSLDRRPVGDPIVAKDWVTYSVSDLTEATENFLEKNLVGRGQSACVYRAHLKGNKMVAVKRLLKVDYELFDKELSILLAVREHKNLVKLFGMCSDPDNQMIVFEYVPNGTLFTRLHEYQGDAGPLSWASRKQIARQVAEALEYLHGKSEPRIIHRDVKSKNVLLVDDSNAKLADFGLAKLCPKNDGSTSTIHLCGTPGYVDPQYWKGGKCSPKSDVYSFGVLLLELITGKKAVNGDKKLVNCTHEYRLSGDTNDMIKIVDQSLTNGNNRSELRKMIRIANRCLEEKREKRLTMTEVVNMMDEIRN